MPAIRHSPSRTEKKKTQIYKSIIKLNITYRAIFNSIFFAIL